MPVETLGEIGAELNLLIKQGSTFGPYPMTFTDPDTLNPIDLTGCELRGQVRSLPSSGTVAATIIFTITSAVDGEATMEIDFEDTEAMAAGLLLTSAESQYYWDCELVDAAGHVLPMLYGTVQVFREVTKS